MFGPVRSYWTEAEDANTMLQFQFDGRALRVSERVVSEGHPRAADLPNGSGPEITVDRKFLALPKGSQRNRVPIVLTAGESLESEALLDGRAFVSIARI